MTSFSPAWETTAPTLRSCDLIAHGCLPCVPCLFISKSLFFFNSVNSLKKGTLASVPALRSICFCCLVSHCLTTLSDVDRKNSQAPLNTLQHLWQLPTAVTPSSVILHGVYHHCACLWVRNAQYPQNVLPPLQEGSYNWTTQQATLRHLRWLLLLNDAVSTTENN
jgi:hypothetical protein